MKRWTGVLWVLGVTGCLSAPGFKGVEDRPGDAGSGDVEEGVGDGFVGAEGVGEPGFEDGVSPEVVGGEDLVEEADGVEWEAVDALEVSEVSSDDGVIEAADLPEGWVCQKDEDCVGLVGPLGACEQAVCLDGQCGRAQAAEGTPCVGDGNPCTVDRCTGTGECVHEPVTCLDPPANTCEGATLVTYASPGQCDRGECEYAKTEKGCAQGCVVNEGVAQCVGEDPCAGVTCDEAPFGCLKAPGVCEGGSCKFEYDDGAACDDGEACSTNDRCAQGVCVGRVMECVEPPKAFCRDATTLVTYAWPGQCEGGECHYTEMEVPCEHGCEVDRDGVAGCVGQDPCAGVDCSKAPSPCWKSPGVCVQGYCVFEYADGAGCEDGDLCTEGDRCEGGQCLAGTPKVCVDENVCTDNFCDPTDGECKTSYNQASCDDGKACTTEDQCSEGSCVGTPVACNTPPPPECEDFQHVKTYEAAGTCEEPMGTCTYPSTVTPCRAGWCQYGYCTGEGMTVVGFLEAGGGAVTGGGLDLRGTLGGWTEGGTRKVGNFVLRVGW